MTSYYLWTPDYSMRVDVSPVGIVRHVAPYVRKTWVGQAWAPIRTQLEAHWGKALRIQVVSHA